MVCINDYFSKLNFFINDCFLIFKLVNKLSKRVGGIWKT
jgi:hypothetical protein